jgi:glutaredoxin-like protein
MDKSMLRKDIQLFGTTWCGDCKRAESWLKGQNIAFAFIDVDQDLNAQVYVKSVNDGNVVVPTILFSDGSILVEPSDDELAAKLI